MKVKASEDLRSFFAKKLSVLKGPVNPPPPLAEGDLDVIQELPVIRPTQKETPKKATKPFKTFFSESKEKEAQLQKERKEREKQLQKEQKEREKEEKKKERERLRLLKKEEKKEEEKSALTGKQKTKKKKDSFQRFFDEQLEEAVQDLVLGAVREEANKKFNEMYLRRRKAILGY